MATSYATSSKIASQIADHATLILMFFSDRFHTKKILRFTILSVIIVFVWVAALFLADYVSSNEMSQQLIAQFGYVGVFVMAVIAGVNVLVPIPAASFVPVFTAAGLWMPLIILALVLGTTLADLIGYFVGHWSREFAIDHYPKTYAKVLSLHESHHQLLLPLIFVYAALIPFPNEAIIIPLALVGIKLRTLLIPLILGNIVNQTALALGASNIFSLLF